MTRLVPFLVLAALAAALWLGWPADAAREAERAPATVASPTAPATPRAVPEEQPPSPDADANAALDARAVWLAKNEEALAALGEGRHAEAVALLEECVAAAPDEATLRRNLAEALVRWAMHLHDVERAYDAAIEHLARAIDLAPDRPDVETLKKILARWRREAAVEEGFWTDDSPYFELVYDAERDDLRGGVQAVLDELHAAYGDLRDWFVVDPVIELARPKFRVVLYDAKGFDELTGLGHWAGGVFDGVLRLRVDDLSVRRGWQKTLRHELVHAFVREVGGADVPSWLNEGLAQVLDGRERRTDPGQLRYPRTLLAQRLEDGGALYTLDEMQQSFAAWSDTDEITAGYAQALLLTVHVLDTYGEHTVRQLLAAAREGVPFAQAFRRETGVEARFLLEDLEAALRR